MARTENDRGGIRHQIAFFERDRKKRNLTLWNVSNKTMKSKLIILSIASLLGCVSCHTIGGVGRDVEAVGNNINSAARSTSQAL